MFYLLDNVRKHEVEHGDYWDIGFMEEMDIAHHEQLATEGNSMICSSTLTYMLDGTVGLTADLALMAQAAALRLD